ncbi:LOW QUALITY PROTEIN: hypothetical protein OSB04_004914 [Centaurea solstitialis]|uniref:Uncharacterized protein n=1 Tax=Centaurea solstitialis TaxID=347529 RepID=A0AA38TF09_9ASTR|nr:LOW QUALITY PROTEIN: hypothetical protein OSB04_004914 [Centaurea solstitialis]
MGVSFRISRKGARFRPEAKPESPSLPEDDDQVDDGPHLPNIQSATTPNRLVDVTEDGADASENLDAEVSFILNIFPDGFSIGNPSESNAVQDDPNFLHPYDRASESLFIAIECGRLPEDFLDDIPCKYSNGRVVCEVRDYRKDSSESGANGTSTVASPTVTKVSLKMSLGNVVKDISLISDSSWTYGDLMELESRVLEVLEPRLCLDPTPNLDRLCKKPTSIKLNLNIPELRRKRLRPTSGAAPASDNQIQEKVSLDIVPENSNFRQGDSRLMMHQPDFVNLTTQDVGQSNMITTRANNQDSSIPSSSVSHQSKYQTGAGNPRHMQDRFQGLAPPPFSPPDMVSSYTDGLSSIVSSVHGKWGNQDGQLSSVANINKRAKSNPMSIDGPQQQQIASCMDSISAPPDSRWKNTLIQQQSTGGGIQYPNVGMQKHPQQMFDGNYSQGIGAMPFTTGEQGISYSLKQDRVGNGRMEKSDSNQSKHEMHMVNVEIDHANPQQSRPQQRFPQQFTRPNFPQTPWNNMSQALENNTRKEEHFQRRTLAQSPGMSAGGVPQSPLSPKSGEFSSGSIGMQFGAVSTAAVGSSQKEKAVVPLVSAVGTRSLTSSSNDSMQRHQQVQMAANWRSNSLPMTHVINAAGSPPSVCNMSGPFTASSPVGEEVDSSMLDRFSKIEMLTTRLQLNCSKKNKIDEDKENKTFSTQELINHLFSEHNDEPVKDQDCKMPLSMFPMGGSLNTCKTRFLKFVQYERMPQGYESMIPKFQVRMILSEKLSDGTVAMHYGDLDDRVAPDDWLPTLPNTHIADLVAAQFCSLMSREGFRLKDDRLQPSPIDNVQPPDAQSSGTSGAIPIQNFLEAVSNQPSTNEVARPSNSGNNNVAISSSHNMSTARMMHPIGNSLSQGGVSTQQQQQPPPQNPPSMLQQQLQRSSATMVASNPLLNIGQSSNMQPLDNHMLNKTSPLQLQFLQQQQQQQQQQSQMQRKMMIGSPGNLGIGGRNIGGGQNQMVGVGLQGMGNVMGMRGGTGNVPPITTTISTGMGSSNMGGMNMNQVANIGNVISQQLRSGQLTQAQATAYVAAKLKMAQSKPNVLGGPGGQSDRIHPGSSGLSMLGSGFNNMNPMQRNAMAPPRMLTGMNQYMQQHLGYTSLSQPVLSPPQQGLGGSASIGMSQQMSQPTPLSPQISYLSGQPTMKCWQSRGCGKPTVELTDPRLCWYHG